MALLSKTKNSVACMIDDRFIRFFHVSKTGKKIDRVNFFSERIPDYLFNEQNELIVDRMLVGRLRELGKKNNFSTVHIVIPDRYITVFHTVIPRSLFGNGSEKSLQQTIERYLEKLLKEQSEFSDNDMIADYEVIGETKEGFDIHVSVARPDQFKHIPQMMEDAGFIVGHIDISSYSVHRLAKHLNQELMHGTISIGSHSTHISTVKNGQVIASSWCQVGSDDLIKTLETVLTISRAEAEKIIHKYGILHIHPDKEVLNALFETLKPVLECLKQVQVACAPGLYRHAYYHTEFDKWYLYGIGSSIPGLAQYLSVKAHASVRPIDIIPTEFIDEQVMVQVPTEVLPIYLPVLSTAAHYLAE